ncbi:MAG: GatB/YqeY domain-containing protein [Deltaproteobacteria bacterium]|nr:GatB/YqeY domain-containing protein [Deltaproteobacteria bacterium]MBW2173372.1 GatB/YqeY domain-containing protein [Deltaproteobacteria bacterium]
MPIKTGVWLTSDSVEMSLKETILQQQNAATKVKDAVQTNTLRMLRAAIKNREVELRAELEDPEILRVIHTQIKQHRESIRQYKEGGRHDLVKKEEEELLILMSFMPEQLSEEAITRTVTRVIEELGATDMRDMGRVMKMLMAKLAGSADGKVVSEIARKQLGS